MNVYMYVPSRGLIRTQYVYVRDMYVRMYVSVYLTIDLLHGSRDTRVCIYLSTYCMAVEI